MTDAPADVAVVGAGPMGTATARILLSRGARVLLVDRSRARLAAATDTLGRLPGMLRTCHGDIADEQTREAIESCRVIAAALSWVDSRALLDRARSAPLRLVSIGRPPPDHRAQLSGRLHPQATVVVGAGLEPGLTEILAHRLATEAGPDCELRLFCGGIPAAPRPPLRHLAWYGERLTIDLRPTFRMEHGVALPVPRFSGVELVEVPELGVLEAFHDGLAPWVADDPVLRTVRRMDQKTLRWPGFAARITTLHELGLVSTEPVSTVDGPIRPRVLLDVLLAPHITPRPGDTDVTVLVAEATARDQGPASVVVSARTDPAGSTTGMGILTGSVLATTAQRLAGGSPPGLLYPHELLGGAGTGELLTRLRQDGASVAVYPHSWVRRPPESTTESTMDSSRAVSDDGASRAAK